MTNIPKIIYQTWKTKNLHKDIKRVRDNIQLLNPDYTMVLYDDADMEQFIKDNFDDAVYRSYMRLNVGASKADFWRYCILYINGGVYLDIDSDIIRPLNQLIIGDEQCIITREKNAGIFNQWIMVFQKNHPILLKAIHMCCDNISKNITDIMELTGPKVFSRAINQVMVPYYDKVVADLYSEEDTMLNNKLNATSNPVRCRFYGFDMEPFARWKNPYSNVLYMNCLHWKNETKIFRD